MKRFKLDEQKQKVLAQINDRYLKDLAMIGVSQNAFNEVHKELLKIEAYGGNKLSWCLFNDFDEVEHTEIKQKTTK